MNRGKNDVKTQGEDDILQAKEKDIEQILPSQPSEENSSADDLILDF